MKYTITIDTGTTNTRAFLWDESRSMAASAKAEVGVHNTAIEGSTATLKQAVRGCIESLLKQAGIGFEDISRVVGCGMITSNVGLAEIPHVFAPAGRKELAKNCVPRLIEGVCPLPILFIPGVKNAIASVDLMNFEAMDMMRGEEVESIAVLESFPKGKPYLLVLPGSHTKFVSIDSEGRIAGCLTTITGELLDCITNHTIIADTVAHQFVREDSYDREMVLKGYAAAAATGIGRAAFSARILNTFAEKDRQKLANYILGAALSSDVQSLHHSTAVKLDPDVTVIVSGKDPLRSAIADILRFDGFFRHVEEFTPDPALPLSAKGAFAVLDAMEE